MKHDKHVDDRSFFRPLLPEAGVRGWVYLFILALCACRPPAPREAETAAGPAWHDTHYPFRAELRLEAPEAGWHRLDLTAERITEWLNREADFAFKPAYFDHNGLVLVELDETGRETGREAEAFFVYVPGPELVINGGFEELLEDGRPAGWSYSHPGFLLQTEADGNRYLEVVDGADRHAVSQQLELQPHTWYRYSHRAQGAPAAGPLVYYAFNNSWQPPRRSWFDPYTPLSGEWYERSFFFHSGDLSAWPAGARVAMERFPGAVDDLSLRACEVAFVWRAESPGPKRYRLYYAPLEGVTPAPPEREWEALPREELTAALEGAPEWLDEGVVATLVSDDRFAVWQAATVRKVLEHTPTPRARSERIRIAAARNEAEAFQLVFRPRSEGELRAVRAELAGPGGYRFAADRFDIRRAHYVTIQEPSRTGMHYQEPSRSGFTGRLPDPLPAFAPVSYAPGDPNILVWVDVAVPRDAPAGLYQGTVTLETDQDAIELALELEVWDFTLPEVMSCRGSFQFGQYANQFLFPFHKVETKEDKYALSRGYIAAMARYRFPQAYPQEAGVHYPGRNYVAGRMTIEEQLENLERELEWAFEELQVNTARVGHISGWGPHIENPDKAHEDAARFEAIAAMLVRRGWIDRCFILIDEPRGVHYPIVEHWIETLRRQPHAGRLQVAVCSYHGYMYDGLKDLVDILIPIDNDYGSVVSPAAIAAKYSGERKAWFYWTCSSHVWIDSPAINHRLWAPKVRAFGGWGMLQWATAQWWTLGDGRHRVENPWENPLTTWGNGVLAFFYPPSPMGRDLPEKDMTIVPSLRLLLTREGIEDFEYAVILERLIGEAQAAGRSTARAEAALAGLRKPFATPVSWRLGEAAWLQAREEAARAIVALKRAGK